MTVAELRAYESLPEIAHVLRQIRSSVVTSSKPRLFSVKYIDGFAGHERTMLIDLESVAAVCPVDSYSNGTYDVMLNGGGEIRVANPITSMDEFISAWAGKPGKED